MGKIIGKYILFMFLLSMTIGNMRSECKFHSFDTSNGLPDNSVQSIGQDKDGYIWLGTRNGLSRFDGKKFISYRSIVR